MGIHQTQLYRCLYMKKSRELYIRMKTLYTVEAMRYFMIFRVVFLNCQYNFFLQ